MQGSNPIPLCLGDVRPLQGDGRAIRVMAFDQFEVLYDLWWEGLGWGTTRLRNKSYYRAVISRVISQPRLRVEPLTEKEMSVHQPDLPLRFLRHRSVNWTQLEADSPEALTAKLSALGWDVASLPGVPTAAITLVCPGPTESAPIRQAKVRAGESGQITATEVLWEAGRLFQSQGMEADNGVGFYRLGVWSGLPAYMLRGYHNYSTWEYEEKSEAALMPEWHTRRKAAGGTYSQRLKAMKRQFPFKQWRTAEHDGLEQYTKENCAAMAVIFDQLIKRLIALGEEAPEPDKLAAFKAAIEATNDLNEQELNLIETGEREQLCELCNEIARAAGLDPTKYGGGEGPASEWRDW